MQYISFLGILFEILVLRNFLINFNKFFDFKTIFKKFILLDSRKYFFENLKNKNLTFTFFKNIYKNYFLKYFLKFLKS